MNPFHEKPRKTDSFFKPWQHLYVKPCDKRQVDPCTRARVILMNGTEYEAVWFTQQFRRHIQDNELRRALALMATQTQTTEVLDTFPMIPAVQEAEQILAEAENPEVTIPQEA